jgi:hypothetical protein
VISAAHIDSDVDQTVTAAAMVSYRKALEAGTVQGFLDGALVAPALRSRAAPAACPICRRIASDMELRERPVHLRAGRAPEESLSWTLSAKNQHR